MSDEVKSYARSIGLRKGETHSSGSAIGIDVAPAPGARGWKPIHLVRVPIRIEVDTNQSISGEAVFMVVGDSFTGFESIRVN